MLKVTLTRSTIACTKKQKDTVAALGLKKPGDSNNLPDNDCTKGMIKVVSHMVKVEQAQQEGHMSELELHNMKPAEGSKKSVKRLGRGIGSGLGKTSGKGHKGQWARSGGGVRPGFEGGQMPLTRRLPKRGFKNRFLKVYTIVNVSELEKFENGTEITPEVLLQNGVIAKIEANGVKVLGNGTLTKKLVVKASKFSKSAVEAIEKAGGTVEVL